VVDLVDFFLLVDSVDDVDGHVHVKVKVKVEGSVDSEDSEYPEYIDVVDVVVVDFSGMVKLDSMESYSSSVVFECVLVLVAVVFKYVLVLVAGGFLVGFGVFGFPGFGLFTDPIGRNAIIKNIYNIFIVEYT